MSTFEELHFYRGFSARHDLSSPKLHFTRKDRRARDIKPEIHSAADKWFTTKFGIAYRSQSVFVTSDLNVALAYADSPLHVGRIVPVGEYRFCWSKQVRDMMQLFIGGCAPENIHKELDGANYIEGDLDAAHRSGHEVMLFCDTYYSFPIVKN